MAPYHRLPQKRPLLEGPAGLGAPCSLLLFTWGEGCLPGNLRGPHQHLVRVGAGGLGDIPSVLYTSPPQAGSPGPQTEIGLVCLNLKMCVLCQRGTLRRFC